MGYQPPFTTTPKIIRLISTISEQIGAMSLHALNSSPQLRKQNRIKTITGTLAIEGNTLSLEQVTAIIEGKHVLGEQREIAEVHGAIKAYDALTGWNGSQLNNLLEAHQLMMGEVLVDAGHFRKGAVGIKKGNEVVHVAPQANRVSGLMSDALQWVQTCEHHPLIVSSVFHYDLEFIHPFSDGNGRMGRLWQTLILGAWKELFYLLPLESVIKDKQQAYYEALSQSDSEGSSTIFIEFMLESIQAVISNSDQVDDQENDQVRKLLAVMGSGWLSSSEMMAKLKLSHKPSFRKNYLNPALQIGLIIMHNPDSPRSPKQKYKKAL